MYNYETSELINLWIGKVTCVRWHPRKPDFILYGNSDGKITCCNYLSTNEKMEYEKPGLYLIVMDLEVNMNDDN